MGPRGEKGEPFKYEDFTPEQLEALRGPQGRDGNNGLDGYTPQREVDYWNETDIAAIEKHCDEYIDTHITQVIGGAY